MPTPHAGSRLPGRRRERATLDVRPPAPELVVEGLGYDDARALLRSVSPLGITSRRELRAALPDDRAAGARV